MSRPDWRDERGALGGMEVLPFGFLLFVAGSLLLTNAWAVVDSKVAASAAAREAARAYVESTGPGEVALGQAHVAARAALEGHGRNPGRMRLDAVGPLDFRRCARVTFEVGYRVATVTVPWVGAFGGGVIETTARHSELVDPYRSDVPGGDATAAGAGCGG